MCILRLDFEESIFLHPLTVHLHFPRRFKCLTFIWVVNEPFQVNGFPQIGHVKDFPFMREALCFEVRRERTVDDGSFVEWAPSFPWYGAKKVRSPIFMHLEEIKSSKQFWIPDYFVIYWSSKYSPLFLVSSSVSAKKDCIYDQWYYKNLNITNIYIKHFNLTNVSIPLS